MTIDFNLTMDDAEAYGLYYYQHSSQIQRQRKTGLIVFYVIASLFFLAAVFFFIRRDITTGIITLIVDGLYILYVLNRFTISTSRKRIRKQVNTYYGKNPNDVICNHKFCISPQGVTDLTNMGESTTQMDPFDWTGITQG